MMQRIFAFLGAMAVACGAFGAHGLKDMVDASQLDIWKTASHYLLIHAAVGYFASKNVENIRAARLFLLGCVVFSGTLYLLVLTQMKWLGAVTPIGGLAFIFGWLRLAFVKSGQTTG